MEVTPTKGHLEAGGTLAVKVKFTPTEPQRTRHVLVFEVESGETQYVSMRAEVLVTSC